MMRKCKDIKKIFMAALCIFCFLAGEALAGVPPFINYQGLLTDNVTGKPIDATVTMTISLFDSVENGNLLWEENQDAVPVVAGVYSVLIGSGISAPGNTMSFAEVVEQNSDLWLQVDVNGDVMTPRQMISSVAFAVRAGSAAVADNLPAWKCAEGQMLVKGASGWQCVTPSVRCLAGDFLSCYSGQVGTMGVGTCAAGTRTCGPDGNFGGCVGEVVPVVEHCDGLDDDCNGLIDDAPGSPTWYEDADGDGYGDQASSRLACSQPAGYVADATDCRPHDPLVYHGAAERCNNQDDNCDGTVDYDVSADQGCTVPAACNDEEIAALNNCANDPSCVQGSVSSTCFEAYSILGQCALRQCSSNMTTTCIQTSCSAEYAAAFENRPAECQFGETRACGSDVGECVSGVETCDNGLWSGVCAGEVAPSLEVCGDNKDNDCNGVIDDPVSWYDDRDGDGFGDSSLLLESCARPSGYVQDGGDCNDSDPAVNPMADDICDGVDNNCDGTIDEFFVEIGQPCSVGVGQCAGSGIFECSPDGWDVVCPAVEGSPGTESCNGLDDDCDGIIDNVNGLGSFCGTGACGGGGMECNGGTFVCSTMPGGSNDQSSPEVCDGMDNDCDGDVDETFIGLGDACTAGIGECAAVGGKVCSPDGSGVVCDAVAGPPATEVCDGRDNDCDGEVDEAFAGLGNTCSVGIGACEVVGTFVCRAGGLDVVCDAVAGTPVAEVCDGVDNDCDGIVDNGCSP